MRLWSLLDAMKLRREPDAVDEAPRTPWPPAWNVDDVRIVGCGDSHDANERRQCHYGVDGAMARVYK